MLLNQRQLEILLELLEKPNEYMTASYFSTKHQCSLRTVQNDIKQLKVEMSSQACASLESTSRNGCRIVIHDNEQFIIMKDSYYQQFGANTVNYPNGRTTQILQLLLKEHRALSLYDLETAIFVSRSTLLNDLKATSEVVKKYNLELLRSSNKVMIDGSEINKRLCMIDQNIVITSPIFHSPTTQRKTDIIIDTLKNFLVQTFVKYKHPITGASLNNAIVRLYIAQQRMQDWFFIGPTDLTITEDLEPELSIAKDVFELISREYFIRVPETEINYFALYLKGQGSFSSTDIISAEIDQLVFDALCVVRDKYGIDMTDNINLRIALGIHTTSLVVRIKYDMQLKTIWLIILNRLSRRALIWVFISHPICRMCSIKR